MKKLIILLALILLISCEGKYTLLSQEIIDGKVSATDPGHIGRVSTLPKIWVQTATTTREVSIPFDYVDRWRVGDDCLLIIEKYKENEE